MNVSMMVSLTVSRGILTTAVFVKAGCVPMRVTVDEMFKKTVGLLAVTVVQIVFLDNEVTVSTIVDKAWTYVVPSGMMEVENTDPQ